MPEHNFEEQARSAMEPFRVEPSAAVWAQLESRLKAARRRRRAFYLFTILGLLAGLGILQWNRLDHASAEAALLVKPQTSKPAASSFESSPAKESGQQASQTKASASAGPIPASSSAEESGQQASASAGSIPASASVVKPGQQASQTQASGSEVRSGEKRPKKKADGAMALGASTGNHHRRAVSERALVQKESGVAETFTEAQQPGKPAVALTTQEPMVEATREARTYVLAEPDHSVKPHSVPAASAILTVPNNRIQLAASDSIMAAIGSIPVKYTRSERFLEFGLSASVGRSAFTEGISFVKMASADQVVSQPGSAPQPLPVPYDYRHDPAFGFSAGAWMGLPISKRWDFRVGLQYQQFSTSTPVGARVDSSRNFTGTLGTQDAMAFYRAGTEEKFTNRFHVLQVPLQFAWKLNPRSNLPVSWSIGLTPGWLLSSNALVYDGNSALYHGAENQQGFQLGLQTGFQFHLFQKSARPLQLGPIFQYQFNQAYREGIQGNGHLYYLGLETSMPLFRSRMKQRSR